MRFVIENKNGQYHIEAQDFEIEDDGSLIFLNTSEGISYDVWEADKWDLAAVALAGGWVNLYDIDESRKAVIASEDK